MENIFLSKLIIQLDGFHMLDRPIKIMKFQITEITETIVSPCKPVESQTKQELIKKENDFENVVNTTFFLANPEITEVTDSPCKTIEPHAIKVCKKMMDFGDDSANSSDNDLPDIGYFERRQCA